MQSHEFGGDALKVILLIALIVAGIMFGPILTIWCLNVLGTDIPYTPETWLAALLLGFMVRGVAK